MALHAAAANRPPVHVALIMDGNRRWASQRGLPMIRGYERGLHALDEAVRAALREGVQALTVYGFSTENWKRDGSEIRLLMQLCTDFARDRCARLAAEGVRVRIVGEVKAFSFAARSALAALVRATRRGTRLTLNLALNYSGRAEIVRAAASIAREVAGGRLKADAIDEDVFRSRLYVPELPDPDLLIRTGGDLRISNFLLYQLAYTELTTLPKLWPDFVEADFAGAVRDFVQRERRFGR